MKLSLKPHHLKRYKDIALLFWKYGTSGLAREFADEHDLLSGGPGRERLADPGNSLERLSRQTQTQG